MSLRRTGSSRRRFASVAATATIALIAGLLGTATGAQAAPSDDNSADAKMEQALIDGFADQAKQDFLIRFKDRADLTKASQIKDWDKRGTAVANVLQKTAERSQANVRAMLDTAGAKYTSYWATNAIWVTKGTEKLAQQMAAQPEVEKLYEPRKYSLPDPIEVKPKSKHQPNTLEWGLQNIHADQVWEQYGVQGEGIVIANIDTGVQYDHPALVNQYRGNNGDGTFDHNYNWFDAAGTCGDAPCDLNGHGSHTMGTMVGDDGAGNQIGVAPGATWIAANGCCPSDQALIDSGQWMLEPTDLNGENPDASKRPNIINNSWGSEFPSNDPFMEDIELAWAASGIFGMWSNGNSGPGCQTSGSPGSRIINYSSGAYDINNNIAGFSGRGPGQDGEIKPNISAPGVNIRSSVPGSAYANYSGTSMASPHVAGTIALLWSAAPSLIGDPDATKELLDQTAIDTEDLQCGGTADDNNVFGEGRLDALALLNAAPIGDTGTLAGTVTDASTGDPVGDATVSVTGTMDRETTTDTDGGYSLILPVGTYDITVSKFGYETATVTGVEVTTDATTTEDVALEPAAAGSVSGTVTDGSGHGWPLYAQVKVTGHPVSTYTNPETGEYSLDLPAGASYELTFTAQYPGYETLTQSVDVSGDVTLDVQLTVDAESCDAPGYHITYEGLLENFDSGTTPEGWTVVDNAETGGVWTFDDPGGRGNLTGGEDGFAIVDSDFYGLNAVQDTSLVSPVFDLTNVPEPTLEFATDYNYFSGDQADVDLSIDGGSTWTNIWSQTTDYRGPATVQIPIPDAAGQSQVQVRYHYVGEFDWWWEVDDVFVGLKDCVPTDGGLVLGNVYESNENTPVNGAKVTSDDKPEESALTGKTDDDPALDDGFYWMFSSLTGDHPFTASKTGYQSDTQTVSVAADDAVRQDFSLGAGHLVVEPTELNSVVTLGGKRTKSFRITNDGTAAAEVELSESGGDFTLLKADGTKVTSKQIAKAKGTKVNRVKADVTPLRAPKSTMKKQQVAAKSVPSADPWIDITDYPTNIMDNVSGFYDGKVYSFGGTEAGAGATDASYVYDPASMGWTPIASMPEGRQKPAAAFVDGKYYMVGGWDENGNGASSALIYDPATDSWSEGADTNPAPKAAAGTAVLDGVIYSVGGCEATCGASDVTAYDTASDTYTTLADYPEPTSWLACGGIDGLVYCAGGNSGSASSTAAYSYDPGSDSWSPVASLPSSYDAWGASYWAANGQLLISGGAVASSTFITNEGYAYDPAADSWTQLPNSNNSLYRGSATCGFYKIGGSLGNFAATPSNELLPGYDDCVAAEDVPWLSESPTTATLQPGDSVKVKVVMDSAQVSQPGTYTASIKISEDTPYSAPDVDVTMQVAPPKAWGKLMGTVEGTTDEGTTPLGGAVVQVNGQLNSYTLLTEADGTYARWFSAKERRFEMIVAKDGYIPKTRKSRVKRGETTVENFTLKQIPRR